MLREPYELSTKNNEIKEFLDENDIAYKEHGYGIVCRPSGVKTEWNTGDDCLVVGMDAKIKPDNVNLRRHIEEYFGEDTVFKPRTMTMSRFCKYAKVADFKLLIEIMSELPFEIQKSLPPFKLKVRLKERDYFMNTAKLIKFAVENSYPIPLNRGDLGLDVVDDIIRIGYSQAAAESIINEAQVSIVREHIVPCKMVIEEAVEMVRKKEPIPKIAGMIKSNLAIVQITEDEAKVINSEYGYLITMPEDWKFGDDIFARLNAAKILLYNGSENSI